MKIKHLLVLLSTVLLALSFAVSAVPNFTNPGAANTVVNDWPGISTYSQGDTVILPNVAGNFVALIYEGTPIYWNPNIEWFSYEPIRNYQTVAIPIPPGVKDGNYYLYEIAMEPVLVPDPQFKNMPFVTINKDIADPANWFKWSAVRGFPIRIQCDLNPVWC